MCLRAGRVVQGMCATRGLAAGGRRPGFYKLSRKRRAGYKLAEGPGQSCLRILQLLLWPVPQAPLASTSGRTEGSRWQLRVLSDPSRWVRTSVARLSARRATTRLGKRRTQAYSGVRSRRHPRWQALVEVCVHGHAPNPRMRSQPPPGDRGGEGLNPSFTEKQRQLTEH